MQKKNLNNLTIDCNKFNELYPDLMGAYNFFNDAPKFNDPLEFESKYLGNKLWRLNNIYKITDKVGRTIPFKMNLAQHIVYANSRMHPRQIILKARQRGISTFWLVSYMDDAIFAPNLTIGLMAQGKEEATMLLSRGRALWENLDDDVKDFANIALKTDSKTEIAFTNNSTIFIRVSFRSATLQRLHVSEMGKIANQFPKRANEVLTGSLQALYQGNTGILESTAEGHNIFKDLWDKAVKTKSLGIMTAKDFYPTFLSWLDDPDCSIDTYQKPTFDQAKYFEKLELETNTKLTEKQKNFWIAQERELGGAVFQEYPATPDEAFRSVRDGTYYAKLFQHHVTFKNRIVKNLYNPTLPVDIYADIGVDDYFVIIATQWYDNEWRIIDEHFNQGKSLQHYLRYMSKLPYKIRAIRFPHDIKVRDLSTDSANGNAVSRYDICIEFVRKNNLKWIIQALPRDKIEQGVEAVRRVIPKLKIDVKCSYIISCFENYSKQYDEKLQLWLDKPIRNKYTHGADAVRQMAVNTIENSAHHSNNKHRKSKVLRPFSV